MHDHLLSIYLFKPFRFSDADKLYEMSWPINIGDKSVAIQCVVVIMCLTTHFVKGQDTHSNQFWTKYELTHAFGNKWASELDLTAQFSDAPGQKSVFATRSQFGAQGWAHYHYSARWRFSGAVAYYDNFYLPEISQNESTEWRFTMQGIYFIHKIGYTLTTRGTTEWRIIRVEDSNSTNAFRYKQRIKFQKPINSNSFRKGIFYLLASEEISFRVNSIKDQSSFLDRNAFSLGGGYILTDNLKLEMTYVNQFLLRSNGNEIINALSVTLTFNNLIGQIQGRFKKTTVSK